MSQIKGIRADVSLHWSLAAEEFRADYQSVLRGCKSVVLASRVIASRQDVSVQRNEVIVARDRGIAFRAGEGVKMKVEMRQPPTSLIRIYVTLCFDANLRHAKLKVGTHNSP